MARQAHKIAKTRGDPRAEVDAETWRKNGQDEATEMPGLSLREATQEHYLPIRGYWHVIIGNVQQAFYDFLNSGEQNESIRQTKWRLAGEVSRLADGVVIAALEVGHDPDRYLRRAFAAVWAFAVVVAVNQIGVATALVNSLFMAVVGAFALALGLAFGLGGRDTAADIVRNWDRKARTNRDKLKTAAVVAAERAKQETQKKGV